MNMFDLFDGTIVKKARKNRGLTQIQLAKAIGMKEVNLHAIETNKRDPELIILGRIAKELQIPFAYLLCGGARHEHPHPDLIDPTKLITDDYKKEIDRFFEYSVDSFKKPLIIK